MSSVGPEAFKSKTHACIPRHSNWRMPVLLKGEKKKLLFPHMRAFSEGPLMQVGKPALKGPGSWRWGQVKQCCGCSSLHMVRWWSMAFLWLSARVETELSFTASTSLLPACQTSLCIRLGMSSKQLRLALCNPSRCLPVFLPQDLFRCSSLCGGLCAQLTRTHRPDLIV